MITALSAALYFVLVSREFFQFQFRLKMKFIFKVFLALVVRFSVAWYMGQDIQEYLVWKAAFKKIIWSILEYLDPHASKIWHRIKNWGIYWEYICP